MPDPDRPDPRFVEQLWARMELEAFGPQRVVAVPAGNRRPQVLLAVAAAVTALGLLAVSSLQMPQAVDRVDVDPAVPVPTATPPQNRELAFLPDPTPSRIGEAPLVGPQRVLPQPAPSAAAPVRDVLVPAGLAPAGLAPAVAAAPPGSRPRPAAGPSAQPAAREQRIVFSSRRSRNGEIYTMRLDGSDVERVSYMPPHRYNNGGDWSPDGRWIAYGSGANGLVVVRPDGEDARVVAKNSCLDPEPNVCAGDLHPSWSPDGRWLVFQRGQVETADCAAIDKCPSLWLVRVDGTGLRRLTENGRDPHWSPDGQRIVFAEMGGVTNSCNLNSSERDCPGELFTIRPDGTDRRALGLVGDTPRWSPDGLQIVYGSRPADSAPHDLFVVELVTGRVRQITSGPGASGGASWSADGTTLIYHYLAHEDEAGDSGPDYEIYLRRLDGDGGVRRLTTSNGLDMLPRFSPR